LYPAGNLTDAPITIRLLGYDRGADIIGAQAGTVVYTDDPERTTISIYDYDEGELVARPTILIGPC
jgi:hypothetical protein